MTKIIRFDRHEVFTKKQYETVHYALSAITLSESEDRWDAENMLYGLYDGYLYPNLVSTLEKVELHEMLKEKGYEKSEVIALVKELVSFIEKAPRGETKLIQDFV